MAEVTGMVVAMKLTWPGKPTEPRLITTASAAAAASCAAGTSMPWIQAMNDAAPMYCTGLVMRNNDTAIGNTRAATAGG